MHDDMTLAGSDQIFVDIEILHREVLLDRVYFRRVLLHSFAERSPNITRGCRNLGPIVAAHEFDISFLPLVDHRHGFIYFTK